MKIFGVSFALFMEYDGKILSKSVIIRKVISQ